MSSSSSTSSSSASAPSGSKFDPKALTWSPKDKASSLELSFGYLRVSYKGAGKYDSDAAAVRTTQPVPPSCGIFFYEVRIVNKGRDGYIGIGLSSGTASLARLPGWEKNSFGYHGDDGQIFKGQGGIPYGPTFTTGDVIGCCFNFIDNTVFYTKNGHKLGVAFRDILNGPVYPVIGLRTPGEVVEANFGTEDFKFNIESIIQDEKRNFLVKMDAQPLDCAASVDLVMSWLIHNGYGQTALTLLKENGHTHSNPTELNQMIDRQQIRAFISEGQIDKAIKMIESLYPDLLQRNSAVIFSLKCQKFIEMIKTSPVEETMLFGQRELYPFYKERVQDRSFIDEVFSLLAYPDPERSPVSYLMDVKRRDAVMDIVNTAILEYQGQHGYSKLDRVIRQALLLKEELIENEASPSAIFMNVSELVRGNP
eukprot:TRINITY_DN11980_c0_g1_i1.p1 TRINITY_DN11980_c0_g1~~TRINITY_DN11980_c0_g1_i1.p1  ORF type:complete len:423 (-),score=89.33 TRINITY_DN11980_c0_g1_i1:31-1299(-)